MEAATNGGLAGIQNPRTLSEAKPRRLYHRKMKRLSERKPVYLFAEWLTGCVGFAGVGGTYTYSPGLA